MVFFQKKVILKKETENNEKLKKGDVQLIIG